MDDERFYKLIRELIAQGRDYVHGRVDHRGFARRDLGALAQRVEALVEDREREALQVYLRGARQ